MSVLAVLATAAAVLALASGCAIAVASVPSAAKPGRVIAAVLTCLGCGLVIAAVVMLQ